MICRPLTLTVNGKTAKLDAPVYLYRGDGAIQFLVEIKELRYKFGTLLTSTNLISENVSYADVTCLKPDGEECFTIPNCLKVQNQIEIIMRPQFMNEINEVGIFLFQIHLYDKQNRRITLPPFEFEVLDVIANPNELEDESFNTNNQTSKTSKTSATSTSKSVSLPRFRVGESISARKLNLLVEKLAELEQKNVALEQELAKLKDSIK